MTTLATGLRRAAALALALLCGACVAWPAPITAYDPSAHPSLLAARAVPPPGIHAPAPLPALRPQLASGEPESFACRDGSHVRLAYAGAGESVSVSLDDASPLLLRRDGGPSAYAAYRGEGYALSRAGPRLVLAPAEASVEVKAGDTLGAIAQRMLGERARAYEIAALNAIDNPDLIFPGQTLRLPGTERRCRRV